MISLYVDPVGLIKNKSSSLAELVAEYTMQNTQGGQTLVLEIKLKLMICLVIITLHVVSYLTGLRQSF